jgi:hypothetical protein
MNTVKILTILALLFSTHATVFAEGETEIVIDNVVSEKESTPVVTENLKKKAVTSVNNYFELELVRGSQSPFNKSIPYTLYITPKVNSSRTQIIWEVPTTLDVRTSHKEFVNLQKDQTYSYRANLVPNRDGTYEISVNVIAWQFDTNYTNSVSSTLTLSKSLVIQPVDSEYTISIMLMIVGGIILLGIGGFFAYKLSQRMVKSLKLWLTPPY